MKRCPHFAWLLAALASAAVLLAAVLLPAPGHAAPQASTAAAAAPAAGTPVCGQPILNSPWNYTGPAGAYSSGTPGLPSYGAAGTDYPAATAGLVVAAGDNSMAAGNGTYQADHTVIYFEPGMHTLHQGMYTGTGTVYAGGWTSAAGPAVLDGGGHPGLDGANAQNADETWKYLTIRNFGSDKNGTVLGNVNGAAFSSGNTYQYDTIGPNEYNGSGQQGQNNGGGYGISFYSNTTIDHSCLTQDSQGAFNGSSGINNKITNNEISKGGLGEYPDDPANPNSCGCTAGGKILDNLNTDVTGNWVHDNYNTGIWADFDNTGLDISNNYVSGNWGSGIAIEGSYNTQVSNNTLVGNGWPSNGPFPSTSFTCFGPTPCSEGYGPITGGGGGNPYGAIELDNSGGNSNLDTVSIPNDVPVQGCSSNCTINSRFSGQLLIQNNVLTDNFGGVKQYIDTDRFPGNVDFDSACAVPLGTGPDGQQQNNPLYYQQTKILQTSTSNSSVSGSAVSSTGGTVTLCSNYGQAQGDADRGGTAQAPSVGMGVFNMDGNTFLGNVASVSSNKSFTLDRSPGNVNGIRLYVAAYGGCSGADYFGGGPGVASGTPSANYWDNCIWGARNATISGNTFTLNSGTVANCTSANMCGVMGTQAFLAGVPSLMQFFQAGYRDRIGNASGGLGNVWSNNTYSWAGSGGYGAWQFQNGSQVTLISQADWTNTFGQDAGSTGLAGASPSPSVSATSPSPSGTPSPSVTPTATGSGTPTPSATPTPTGSGTPTVSGTPTPSATPTPTSSGGSVTYDATGPGTGGAKCTNCHTLSWKHTVTGTVLLAGVAAGLNNDGGLTAKATWNGTPLTLLKQVHAGGHPNGFLDVFGLTHPATGTGTLTVTTSGGNFSGNAAELTGGSESFTSAGSFAAPIAASGTGTTPTVTTSSAPGGMIAGFTASGSAISSTHAPATTRYIANQDGNTGAGNSAGATSPGTGSNVTMAWTAASDYWAAIAIPIPPA